VGATGQTGATGAPGTPAPTWKTILYTSGGGSGGNSRNFAQPVEIYGRGQTADFVVLFWNDGTPKHVVEYVAAQHEEISVTAFPLDGVGAPVSWFSTSGGPQDLGTIRSGGHRWEIKITNSQTDVVRMSEIIALHDATSFYVRYSTLE
jgi:hypothetical protein